MFEEKKPAGIVKRHIPYHASLSLQAFFLLQKIIGEASRNENRSLEIKYLIDLYISLFLSEPHDFDSCLSSFVVGLVFLFRKFTPPVSVIVVKSLDKCKQ